MGDKEIKVTDKRMFTADGELREDYRHLEDADAPTAAPTPTVSEPPVPDEPRDPPAAEAAARDGRVEIPGSPPELAPGFLDLVSVLAEPVPLYLGDAELPEGRSIENLDAARFHIDLLDVLRQRTAGNLTAEESRALESVLYQLRMRYVQKRG